jgi:hypothetical protein
VYASSRDGSDWSKGVTSGGGRQVESGFCVRV